jgi:hypothetical protein
LICKSSHEQRLRLRAKSAFTLAKYVIRVMIVNAIVAMGCALSANVLFLPDTLIKKGWKRTNIL